MSFPIDTTIPAAGNNPSNDQPKMLANNQNINGYLTVDHVIAGVAQNGIHKQSSYLAQGTLKTLTNPVITPNGSDGIAYVHDNSATPTNFTNTQFSNDYYYFNGPGVTQSTYPLNLIRAYGLFNGGVGPTLQNGFNITGVNRASVGVYNVSFSQPSAGTNYGFLINAFRTTVNNTGIICTVVVQNITAIQIQFLGINPTGFNALVDPTTFTVTILGV